MSSSIEQSINEVEILQQLTRIPYLFEVLTSLLVRLGLSLDEQDRLLLINNAAWQTITRVETGNVRTAETLNKSNDFYVGSIMAIGGKFPLQACQYIVDFLSGNHSRNTISANKEFLVAVTRIIAKLESTDPEIRESINDSSYTHEMLRRLQQATNELLALKEMVILDGSGIGESGELRDMLQELLIARRTRKEMCLHVDNGLIATNNSIDNGADFIKEVRSRLENKGIKLQHSSNLMSSADTCLQKHPYQLYFSQQHVNELVNAIYSQQHKIKFTITSPVITDIYNEYLSLGNVAPTKISVWDSFWGIKNNNK